LQLTYVEDLLAALKTLFVKLFEPFLATLVASLHAINTVKASSAVAGETASSWNFAKAIEGWDKVFDTLLKGLEDKAAQVSQLSCCACDGYEPIDRTASRDYVL
jgi:signal recognition particle receptor subunit alpha